MGSAPEVTGLESLVEIGRGGFGVVYRAVERDLDRPVAVKVLYGPLDAAAVRRFGRERRAMGKVSGHPNVVTVYRAGLTDEDQPYIVMELMGGGSMRDRIQREGPLPWEAAVEIGILIASALEVAHEAGVHHRDIKPGNILVSSHGVPKLADFGIAALSDTTETTSAAVTASLAHAAPEVVSGEHGDERSDIYSLGSTLYELIHGSPPYARDGDDSIVPMLVRIIHDEPPELTGAGVPPAVRDVIAQTMRKDPAQRPASAAALLGALRAAQTSNAPRAAGAPAGTLDADIPDASPAGASTGTDPDDPAETAEPDDPAETAEPDDPAETARFDAAVAADPDRTQPVDVAADREVTRRHPDPDPTVQVDPGQAGDADTSPVEQTLPQPLPGATMPVPGRSAGTPPAPPPPSLTPPPTPPSLTPPATPPSLTPPATPAPQPPASAPDAVTVPRRPRGRRAPDVIAPGPRTPSPSPSPSSPPRDEYPTGRWALQAAAAIVAVLAIVGLGAALRAWTGSGGTSEAGGGTAAVTGESDTSDGAAGGGLSGASGDTSSGDDQSGGGQGGGEQRGVGEAIPGITLTSARARLFVAQTAGRSAAASVQDYERYVSRADDAATVTVDVPASWNDVQSDAGFIAAGPDLTAFMGSYEDSGMAAVLQSDTGATPDETLDGMVEPGCTGSQRFDYDSGDLRGRADVWEGCGGYDDVVVVHVAAAPADGTGDVLIVSVQMAEDRDVLAATHIIQTVRTSMGTL